MTEHEELRYAINGFCPTCLSRLEWGPQGGLSQIAVCRKCAIKYNVSPVKLERLGKVYIDEKGDIWW